MTGVPQEPTRPGHQLKQLVLPCTHAWFDDIRKKILETGSAVEYRPCSDYWVSRIEGKQYDVLVLTRGRPTRALRESAPWGEHQMIFPWPEGGFKRQAAPPLWNMTSDIYTVRLAKPGHIAEPAPRSTNAARRP